MRYLSKHTGFKLQRQLVIHRSILPDAMDNVSARPRTSLSSCMCIVDVLKGSENVLVRI